MTKHIGIVAGSAEGAALDTDSDRPEVASHTSVPPLLMVKPESVFAAAVVINPLLPGGRFS